MERTGVVSMLMPRKEHIDQRVIDGGSARDGLLELHVTHVSWYCLWNTPFPMLVPLDRWEEMVTRKLPYAFACVGSLPARYLSFPGDHIDLLGTPPLGAYFAKDAPWNDRLPDDKVAIRRIVIEKRTFVWEEPYDASMQELNFVAGGEELQHLLKVPEFELVERSCPHGG